MQPIAVTLHDACDRFHHAKVGLGASALMRRETVDDRRAVAAELPCILRF
ncbi:MAG: hypothetical protein WA970_11930 [Gammaproteobacteria bacterium]